MARRFLEDSDEPQGRLVHVTDERQHLVGEAVWCDEMHRVPVPIEGSEATVR